MSISRFAIPMHYILVMSFWHELLEHVSPDVLKRFCVAFVFRFDPLLHAFSKA